MLVCDWYVFTTIVVEQQALLVRYRYVLSSSVGRLLVRVEKQYPYVAGTC